MFGLSGRIPLILFYRRSYTDTAMRVVVCDNQEGYNKADEIDRDNISGLARRTQEKFNYMVCLQYHCRVGNI